jgi:hypothetical protein
MTYHILIAEPIVAEGSEREFCSRECGGYQNREYCSHFGKLDLDEQSRLLRKKECCQAEALHGLAGSLKKIIKASQL